MTRIASALLLSMLVTALTACGDDDASAGHDAGAKPDSGCVVTTCACVMSLIIEINGAETTGLSAHVTGNGADCAGALGVTGGTLANCAGMLHEGTYHVAILRNGVEVAAHDVTLTSAPSNGPICCRCPTATTEFTLSPNACVTEDAGTDDGGTGEATHCN
jgi:hypothetical protein